MKTVLSVLIIVLAVSASQVFAQTELPDFLHGTWKVKNQEMYEYWNSHEDGSMKGYSYKIVDGKKVMSEHLEIRQRGEEIVYMATVLNQNEGKGVDFILNQPDSVTFSFENPEHDFPQKIVYQKKSASKIYVQVSDDGDRGFAYHMKKVNVEEPNVLLSFFSKMTGMWIANPADSSFVSRLEYKKGEEQFLLTVDNVLTSKTGEPFAKYEGVYIYNPVVENILFTTVTKDEIHTGICEVKGDTLFHKAQIAGNDSIKSYSSAIVKMADGTLHYYANYSDSKTMPDLKLNEPLIYKKQ